MRENAFFGGKKGNGDQQKFLQKGIVVLYCRITHVHVHVGYSAVPTGFKWIFLSFLLFLLLFIIIHGISQTREWKTRHRPTALLLLLLLLLLENDNNNNNTNNNKVPSSSSSPILLLCFHTSRID